MCRGLPSSKHIATWLWQLWLLVRAIAQRCDCRLAVYLVLFDFLHDVVVTECFAKSSGSHGSKEVEGRQRLSKSIQVEQTDFPHRLDSECYARPSDIPFDEE